MNSFQGSVSGTEISPSIFQKSESLLIHLFCNSAALCRCTQKLVTSTTTGCRRTPSCFTPNSSLQVSCGLFFHSRCVQGTAASAGHGTLEQQRSPPSVCLPLYYAHQGGQTQTHSGDNVDIFGWKSFSRY